MFEMRYFYQINAFKMTALQWNANTSRRSSNEYNLSEQESGDTYYKSRYAVPLLFIDHVKGKDPEKYLATRMLPHGIISIHILHTHTHNMCLHVQIHD